MDSSDVHNLNSHNDSSLSAKDYSDHVLLNEVNKSSESCASIPSIKDQSDPLTKKELSVPNITSTDSFSIDNILKKNIYLPNQSNNGQNLPDPYSFIPAPPKGSSMDKKICLFRKPFELGFQRKVCIRQSLLAVAVYYFPPNSKARLRCLSDVKRFLQGDDRFTGVLSENNFNFSKHRLYRPPQEIVRFASKNRGRTKTDSNSKSGKESDDVNYSPPAKRSKLINNDLSFEKKELDTVDNKTFESDNGMISSYDIASSRKQKFAPWISMPPSISNALSSQIILPKSSLALANPSTQLRPPQNSLDVSINGVIHKSLGQNNFVKYKPGPASTKSAFPKPYYPPGPKFSKRKYEYEEEDDDICDQPDDSGQLDQDENVLCRSLHLKYPHWFTREKRKGKRPSVPIYSSFECVMPSHARQLGNNYQPPCSKFCFPTGVFPDLECQKCHLLWHNDCVRSADNNKQPLRCVYICHNCMKIDQLNKQKKTQLPKPIQPAPTSNDSRRTPLLVSKNLLNRMSGLVSSSNMSSVIPMGNILPSHSIQLHPPLLANSPASAPSTAAGSSLSMLNSPLLGPQLLNGVLLTNRLENSRNISQDLSLSSSFNSKKEANAKEVCVTTGESTNSECITKSNQLGKDSTDQESEITGLVHSNVINSVNDLKPNSEMISITVSKSCVIEQTNSTAMLSLPKMAGLMEILQQNESFLTICGTSYAVSPENVGDFKYIVKILLPEMPPHLQSSFKIVISRHKDWHLGENFSQERHLSPALNSGAVVMEKSSLCDNLPDSHESDNQKSISKFSTKRRHVKLQVNLPSKIQIQLIAAKDRLNDPLFPPRPYLQYPGCLLHHNISILDSIFDWLTVGQLIQYRLVCRQWRRIIDSSDRLRSLILKSCNVRQWNPLLHCLNLWNTKTLTLKLSDSNFIFQSDISNKCHTLEEFSLDLRDCCHYILRCDSSDIGSPPPNPNHTSPLNRTNVHQSRDNGKNCSIQEFCPLDCGFLSLSSVVNRFLPLLPQLRKLSLILPSCKENHSQMKSIILSSCIKELELRYSGNIPDWIFSLSQCTRLSQVKILASNCNSDSLVNYLKESFSNRADKESFSIQVEITDGTNLEDSVTSDDKWKELSDKMNFQFV